MYALVEKRRRVRLAASRLRSLIFLTFPYSLTSVSLPSPTPSICRQCSWLASSSILNSYV